MKLLANFLIFIAAPFMVCSLIGFTYMILIYSRVIDNNNELPLNEVCGLVVNDNDNIFIGLESYRKVQVYNKEGEYLRNFNVDVKYGGSFYIELNQEGQIHIITAKANQSIIYDEYGNEISRRITPNIFKNSLPSTNYHHPKDQITAQIEGKLTPALKITGYNGKDILIEQSIFTHLTKDVFPSFFVVMILACFFVPLLILHKRRTTKKLSQS